MVASEELLPQAVLRSIGDKLYEKVCGWAQHAHSTSSVCKLSFVPHRALFAADPPPHTPTHKPQRKVAALEVEQVVKRLAASNDHPRIRAIIDKLIAEYAFSPQANHRKVCVRARVCGGGDAPHFLACLGSPQRHIGCRAVKFVRAP
jgi:hypothetical protein